MEQRGKRVGQAKQGRLRIDETGRPDDDSSVPQSWRKDEQIRQVFEGLTNEERQVSALKKAGFSNWEIAKWLGVSVETIDELIRTALTKVRPLRPFLETTPHSDGGLPPNCPFCGSRLAYQGQKRHRSVYTCHSHGEFHLDTKRGLQHVRRE